MEKEKKTIVVVIGMGRSGTSAVTRGLLALGLNLGRKLLPPVPENNDKGFFEDAQIQKFNDVLLQKLDSSWDSLELVESSVLLGPEFTNERKIACELLSEKIAENPNFAFKDPRTSLLLEFWQSIFKDLDLEEKYVIVIRNPLEVAKSLKKRDCFSYVKSLMLWAKYNMAILRGTISKQRIFVAYNDMLKKPKEQLIRLSSWLGQSETNINQKELIEYCCDFLTPTLHRNIVSEENLTNIDRVPPFIKDLFVFLKVLTNHDIDSRWSMQTQVYDFEFRYREFIALMRQIDMLENRNNKLLREIQQINMKHKKISQDKIIIECECKKLFRERTLLLLDQEKIKNRLKEQGKKLCQMDKDLKESKKQYNKIINSYSWRLVERLRAYHRKVFNFKHFFS